MNSLLQNLDKLHTTKMGVERIRRNLDLQTDDVVAWCRTAILDAQRLTKLMYWQKGKNWYIHIPEGIITVNAKSLTVITAHKATSRAVAREFDDRGLNK